MNNKQILFNVLNETIGLNQTIREQECYIKMLVRNQDAQAEKIRELKQQIDANTNNAFIEEMVGLMRAVRQEHVMNPAAIKLKLDEILKRYGRE